MTNPKDKQRVYDKTFRKRLKKDPKRLERYRRLSRIRSANYAARQRVNDKFLQAY